MYCSTLSKQFTLCLFLMLRKWLPAQRLSLYSTLPLGDKPFFLGSSVRSESMFQLICSHEKRKSHTFLQNFWSTKISWVQLIAFLFSLIFFWALSVDPHPTFFSPEVSLSAIQATRTNSCFSTSILLQDNLLSLHPHTLYIVLIVFPPQTKVPSFSLFIFGS